MADLQADPLEGSNDKTYLTVDGFSAFWHHSQPDRIHLATKDPRFIDENGEKPGIRIVFSSNPASADYNPANFNRIARALRAIGAPAPDDVPVASRKLKDRGGVVPPKKGMTTGALDQLGWSECPTCKSVVTDLDAHEEAMH